MCFVACGEGGSPEATGASAGAQASSPSSGQDGTVVDTKEAPSVTVPSGPPPTGKVIVEDLKKGAGSVIKQGPIGINYIGIDYETRKPFEVDWGKPVPPIFNYGTDEVIKGWEVGLKGMRVGGRRELIVPAKLAYGNGAVVYMIELLTNE